MGKRGPAPAPTKLRVVRGDRADRINTSEPQPAAVDIVPPAWLSDAGVQVWQHYAPDLQRTGVLTAWDVEAFAQWCDATVRRAAAVQALDEQGELVESPVYDRNGVQTGTRIVRNQWALVLRDADAISARLAARFGLTPSDRAQLRLGGEQRDPSADLLSG